MKERKKSEEKKEHKKPWREYTATVEDIQNFLMDRVLLRHNVITGRVESLTPNPSPIGRGVWQPISDRVVNSLWAELSATKAVRVQDMYRVIESDFVPEYHPFRFYLEHLPPWNGEDYILAMSVSVNVKGGVEEQLLFAEYFRKWLVGMVAGWVDDVVQDDVVQLPAAAGASHVFLYEDERPEDGARRPADVGAVRIGVLRGA